MLLILLAFCVNAAQAQLYRNRFETGDTLISNTPDTTTRCLIYNTSTQNPRPIRPTVYIPVTEIGTNTTHYWIRVDVDVADRALAKDGNGWANVMTHYLNDWTGYNSESQGDFVIAMPYLDSYAGSYFRLRLLYPIGADDDSTAYECVYCADQSGNVVSQTYNDTKIVSHFDLWSSNDSKLIIGGVDTYFTTVIDFRVQRSPGVYKLADRAVLEICGDQAEAKCEDDTMMVYVSAARYNNLSDQFIDTLTIPIGISSVGVGELSFLLNGGGNGFVDAASFKFVPEENNSGDSCYVYTTLILQCD